MVEQLGMAYNKCVKCGVINGDNSRQVIYFVLASFYKRQTRIAVNKVRMKFAFYMQ
jgi:hypothetical protein